MNIFTKYYVENKDSCGRRGTNRSRSSRSRPSWRWGCDSRGCSWGTARTGCRRHRANESKTLQNIIRSTILRILSGLNLTCGASHQYFAPSIFILLIKATLAKDVSSANLRIGNHRFRSLATVTARHINLLSAIILALPYKNTKSPLNFLPCG